jgi:hypothetical protein
MLFKDFSAVKYIPPILQGNPSMVSVERHIEYSTGTILQFTYLFLGKRMIIIDDGERL